MEHYISPFSLAKISEKTAMFAQKSATPMQITYKILDHDGLISLIVLGDAL